MKELHMLYETHLIQVIIKPTNQSIDPWFCMRIPKHMMLPF